MAAPKLCIPQAVGVPALGGAPNWYDSAPGEPGYWPRLDDPRWQGALARSWGSGASEHVQFRALRDANSLYLSWWVKVDPQLSPFLDRLFVAFSPGVGQDELIEIRPFSSASSNITAGPPASTGTRLRPAAGTAFGAQVPAEPAWLGSGGKTKIWLDTAEQVWAINMVVPVSNDFNIGINLQSTFKLWFELQVTTSATMMTPYRLVDTLTLGDIEAGLDASSWPEMSRIHNLSDAANCTQQISITSTDVGTNNVDSGAVARPNRIALDATNTFYARPTNGTGNAVPANQICAQFRLANWGTQPDWNQVANPTTSLWKLISPQCGLAGQRTNPMPIPAGATAGPGNEITFPWTPVTTPGDPNDVDRCEFIGQSGIPAQGGLPAVPGDPSCPNPNPTRRRHQCMLVELSGGGLTYAPSSVYRNMDFVDASTFEREAEISVAGLTNLAGPTHRDVYLYVKTLNMPPNGSSSKPSHVLRELEKAEKIRSGRGSGSDSGGESDGGTIPPINGRSPKEPFDVLDQVFPTYVIHAYHDTGKTVTVNGTTMKILRPQSSFGYYVLHRGSLNGWTHSLLGGVERVGPDFYRLRVPQGGSAVIKTQVTAHEQGQQGGGGGGDGCGCPTGSGSKTTPSKVGTLGMFMAVGAVVFRRRRRR